MNANPKVDAYLERAGKWAPEIAALRAIAQGFPLEEELKWGQPCYALAGKNVVLIGGEFKDYCVLLFMKGALIPDPDGVLVAPGGHQAARQIRFTSLSDIKARKALAKRYIAAAIEVEKSGAKVAMKPHSEYAIPDELQHKIDTTPAFKTAWEKLTPGRQRGYMLHIGSAKQSATRTARVEKCFPAILAGKGWNE